MTTKRMSEERWNELRKFDVGDPTTWPAVEISESELIAEIDALRAELTAARTVEDGEVAKVVERQSQLAAYFDGRQSTMVIRAKEAINLLVRLSAAKAEAGLLLQVERGAARAALAQAREAALEEAATICDAEDGLRSQNAVEAEHGSEVWGEPKAAFLAQSHKAVTARTLAIKIRARRALKTTPTQESETP